MKVVLHGVEAAVGRALDAYEHSPHLQGDYSNLSAPPTYCVNPPTAPDTWGATKGTRRPLHLTHYEPHYGATRPFPCAYILSAPPTYCGYHSTAPIPWGATKGNRRPPHHTHHHHHYGATRPSPCAYNVTLLIDPTQVLITQGIHPHPGPQGHPTPSTIPHTAGETTHRITTLLNTTIKHLEVEAWDSLKPGVNIAVNNVTCAKTHIKDICENSSHFMFLSEVSANPSVFKQLQHDIRDCGGQLVGVPLNPNTAHNVGGVACKAQGSHRAIMITPITQAFKDVVELGRVALFCIDIGGGHNIFSYII
jgi:hypothetical protein